MEFCFGEMHFQGVVLRDDTNRCIVYTAKYPIYMSNISQSLDIRKDANIGPFVTLALAHGNKHSAFLLISISWKNEFCKVCGSELPKEINLMFSSPQSE